MSDLPDPEKSKGEIGLDDLKVKNEDLIFRSRTEAFQDWFAGFGFGFLGFLPLSVGTKFFDWLLARIGPYFLVVWFGVGILAGLLTYYYRPKISRWFFVGTELAVGYRKYKSYLIRAFALGALLAILGLVLTYAPNGWKNTNVGLTLSGIAYFALIPTLTAGQVLKSDNQAKLFIFQFLLRGTDLRAKVWLRRGLRRVEDRIPEDGILRVSQDSLFLGCLYQLQKQIDVKPELMSLSDWVVNRAQTPNLSIERLLTSAGEARRLGLSPIPTMIERIKEMPKWSVSLIAGAFGYVLVPILSYFGLPSPIIEALKEVLSRL